MTVLIKSELYSVFIGVTIIAFTMGLILEVFQEGETAKLKVFSSFVESKMYLLIQEAELAGVPVEIQSGDVGFTIEVLADDDGFLINAITECKFVTNDEVPHPTCVNFIILLFVKFIIPIIEFVNFYVSSCWSGWDVNYGHTSIYDL